MFNNSIKIIEHKISSTETKIHKLTKKIEIFIERSNRWLRDNSGGKYGLE